MDTLVTVLDAYNFASILGEFESESDRKKYFGDEGDEVDNTEGSKESIVQLLIDQIEFANVILVNKIDLLKGDVESQINAIRSVVKKLNPKAAVLVPDKPEFANFDVNTIIGTELFDMEEAEQSAGWIAEVRYASQKNE